MNNEWPTKKETESVVNAIMAILSPDDMNVGIANELKLPVDEPRETDEARGLSYIIEAVFCSKIPERTLFIKFAKVCTIFTEDELRVVLSVNDWCIMADGCKKIKSYKKDEYLKLVKGILGDEIGLEQFYQHWKETHQGLDNYKIQDHWSKYSNVPSSIKKIMSFLDYDDAMIFEQKILKLSEDGRTNIIKEFLSAAGYKDGVNYSHDVLSGFLRALYVISIMMEKTQEYIEDAHFVFAQDFGYTFCWIEIDEWYIDSSMLRPQIGEDIGAFPSSAVEPFIYKLIEVADLVPHIKGINLANIDVPANKLN